MRSQGKAILLGGLLVFLGYVLGRASDDGMVYAQAPASSGEWAAVSVPDGGGVVLFRDFHGTDVTRQIGRAGRPTVFFVDSNGGMKVARR
jgi:hypothetical protein